MLAEGLALARSSTNEAVLAKAVQLLPVLVKVRKRQATLLR